MGLHGVNLRCSRETEPDSSVGLCATSILSPQREEKLSEELIQTHENDIIAKDGHFIVNLELSGRHAPRHVCEGLQREVQLTRKAILNVGYTIAQAGALD